MKRYIAFLLALLMLFTAVGCSRKTAENSTGDNNTKTEAVDDDKLKVGFILPAEPDSPDSKARVRAIRKMQNTLGIEDRQVIISYNINKDVCPDIIKEMDKQKCQMIFTLGARYEEAVLEAAQKYKDVQFCIEGGRDSITCGLSNVHTFNSRIYEAYYAEGVIAGMKLNDMLNRGQISSYDCRVGFVAYNGCPETSACVNAFYLGIQTQCSRASIDIRYVGKRGNYDKDGEAARQLAESGVGMMATYTYTSAPGAICSEYGIPMFGNEDNMINVAPKHAITSAYTDWSIYYVEAVNSLLQGTELYFDWCGGYNGKVVSLTQLNDAYLVDGTAEKLMEVEKDLRKGKIKIFDTEKFTFDGEHLEDLVKEDDDYKPFADFVADGELKEQMYISAPIFERLMDGITISLGNYIPEEKSEEATTEEQ